MASPYPGTGENSALNVSIDDSKAWQLRIDSTTLRVIRAESETRVTAYSDEESPVPEDLLTNAKE